MSSLNIDELVAFFQEYRGDDYPFRFHDWMEFNEQVRVAEEEANRASRDVLRTTVRAVDLEPLEDRGSPDHDDSFLTQELIIALALFAAASESAREVSSILNSVLADPESFNEQELQRAIEEASRVWEGTFDLAEVAVVATIAAALVAGVAKVSTGILQGVPSVQGVLDGMRRVAKFSTNAFFNEQVIPALQASVLEMMSGTGAMVAPDLAVVRAVLDRRLKSVPYWRVVANAAASRSYHYGLLKAAQFQGLRGYRFVAIIDKRTSEICNSLDGREWHIADAVNLMERVAAADGPGAVKEIAPWLGFQSIQGLDNNALRDLGVMVPPLHGNCRSTVVPI